MNMNEKLKQELSHYGREEWSQGSLQKTCAAARAAYGEQNKRERIGFWQFFVRQIRFAGGSLWILQAAVLIVTCLILDIHFQAGASGYGSLGFVLSLASVATAMTGIPYLCRSVRHGMYETETASRVSFAGLLLAKLLITGIGNLIMLAAFFALASLKMPLSINAIGYMLLPFSVIWLGIMVLMRLACDQLLPALCAAFSIIIMAALFALYQIVPQVFGQSSILIWNIVCIVIIAGLAWQIRTMAKKPAYMDGVSM